MIIFLLIYGIPFKILKIFMRSSNPFSRIVSEDITLKRNSKSEVTKLKISKVEKFTLIFIQKIKNLIYDRLSAFYKK